MAKPLVLACLTIAISAAVQAAPITFKRTFKNTNAVQAGVSGIGTATGSIAVTGVSGTVTHAFLYWHGINNSGAGATYNNPTISFNGVPVTGVSQGDASTNCWGAGSSRAFEADVTSRVAGNGTYALGGFSSAAGYSTNGASMIVVFDDGNSTNNRDYVFYTGNDSISADGAFPGDPSGWAASLNSIGYRGGAARVTMHAPDGQAFADGPVSFSTANGAQTIADTNVLWDSRSVPNAGSSRAADGLYDVHQFDVTSAFGGVTGPATLTMNAPAGGDCLALTALVMDLEPGSAPFTTCAAEGITGAKLSLCRQICEIDQTPTKLTGLIKLYMSTYRSAPACAN